MLHHMLASLLSVPFELLLLLIQILSNCTMKKITTKEVSNPEAKSNCAIREAGFQYMQRQNNDGNTQDSPTIVHAITSLHLETIF